MPAQSSEVRQYVGRIAALTRSRTPDDPVLVDARRALEIARNSARIDALIAAATPLTDEQRTRLAELLKPVRIAGGGA